MKTIYLFTFILCLCIPGIQAQISPVDGSVLHYRVIGFTLPADYSQYTLEVAQGDIYREDSFTNQIIKKRQSTTNKIIEAVPEFGKAYTWRAKYTGPNGKQTITPLYHFTTGTISYIDTYKYRVRILTQAPPQYKDLLLFSDCNRALLDIDGNPVWYLPQIPGVLDSTIPVRDLKMSSFGTITFIANTKAYEITYDGRLLWQAPDDGTVSGDSNEHYHHEFTTLANGHYMIAGNQTVRKELPASLATRFRDNENIKQENGKYFTDVLYGTLIEYDANKKIIWSWKASEHFPESDLLNTAMFENAHVPGFHFNGFFFDEKRTHIYASFRDINRVIKIDYPTGKVLASYSTLTNGTSETKLMGQHNCGVNKDGNLYLFNNNSALNKERTQKQVASSVLILKEPTKPNKLPAVKWMFNCDIDPGAPMNAKGGGSVFELRDGSLLVCMGTANRIFIVSPGKQVLFNALTEIKNEGRWLPLSNYRVSVIENMQLLEKAIFNPKAQ